MLWSRKIKSWEEALSLNLSSKIFYNLDISIKELNDSLGLVLEDKEKTYT